MAEQFTGSWRVNPAAKRRLSGAGSWTAKQTRGWETVRRLLKPVVGLSYQMLRWLLLMFSDASDLSWDCCMSQVYAMQSRSSMLGE